MKCSSFKIGNTECESKASASVNIKKKTMILRNTCKNSRLLCRCFFKQPEQLLRISSYLPQIQIKSVLLDKSKYEIVYDFPAIKFTAAILRTKLSFPAAVIVSAPFLWFYSRSLVTPVLCLLSGGSHYLLISLLSKFSQNLVGKIYVNKDNVQDVIISSLDEFGRRIDRNHKLDDIINCDFYTYFSRSFGFIRLGIQNSDIYYTVSVRHCNMHNSEVCDYLLGRILSLKTKNEPK